MPTITADVRLRNQILEDENVILIVEPGYSDKVIKIVPLPDCVAEFRKNQIQERVDNSDNKNLRHTQIDISRGPEQELWRSVEREVFMKADRNKPMVHPAEVNNKLGEPWMLAMEEVPVIFLSSMEPASVEKKQEDRVEEGESFACKKCDFQGKSEKSLQVHVSLKHK